MELRLSCTNHSTCPPCAAQHGDTCCFPQSFDISSRFCGFVETLVACLLTIVASWRHYRSKVHGAIMGPIWGRQDPSGPHVGPMNFAIWVVTLWRVVAQWRHGDMETSSRYVFFHGHLWIEWWQLLLLWGISCFMQNFVDTWGYLLFRGDLCSFVVRFVASLRCVLLHRYIYCFMEIAVASCTHLLLRIHNYCLVDTFVVSRKQSLLNGDISFINIGPRRHVWLRGKFVTIQRPLTFRGNIRGCLA